MPDTPKILIVDDRPENLFAMRAVLSQLDVEIIEADSGNAALMHTLNHEFAMCLLDVQMPDMDGFEVAELLRLSEKTKNVPVIFVTAKHQTVHDQVRGYEAGAVDYILKPIDETVLFNKVGTLLKIYQHQQEIERQHAQLEEEITRRIGVEKELRTMHDELEVMVEERTAELRTSNHELVRRVRESMKAVATLNLFRELIDRADEAILVADIDEGRLLDSNTALTELTGYSRDALRTMSILDLALDLPGTANWDSFIDRLEYGPVMDNAKTRCNGNKTVEVHWKVDLIRRGGGQYLAATLRTPGPETTADPRPQELPVEQINEALDQLHQSTQFLFDTVQSLEGYVRLADELVGAAAEAGVDSNMLKNLAHKRPQTETLQQLTLLLKESNLRVATLCHLPFSEEYDS